MGAIREVACVSDYLSYREAFEWDERLHREGHAAARTEICDDPECPHLGRNRPLPAGVILTITGLPSDG